MGEIECIYKDCSHFEACNAWIRHGTTLYDDYDYSVTNCPYYTTTIDAIKVIHGTKGESVISKTGLMCTACHSDIDRDAVFCKYCGAKMDEQKENIDFTHMFDNVKKLELLPTEKSGKWEKLSKIDCRCSECHKAPIVNIWDKFVLSEYCPHCGAKMDGQGTTNNNIAAKIEISKVKEMLEQIKCRFYYHFEELMPSIMVDEIDEIFNEYCEK
jgi:predicted amidophosphoribosyltransferase